MKNLFKVLNFVKNNKSCTSKKTSISPKEVERMNAGNSTSSWGLVFYR